MAGKVLLGRQDNDYKDLQDITDETFLNGLSDEQTGFFYAHEYDDNLEDLIQDHISMKQFAMFAEWKKQETKTQDANKLDISGLVSKLDNVANMLVILNKRIDCIESRMISELVLLKEKHIQLELKLSMDIEKIFTLEDTEDTKGRLRSVAQKIEDVDQQMISLSQTCLPSFDSDEIGKKWLDNFLTQIGDTVTKEAKAKQGSKENIKNILALMKRFKDNEYFEEKGSRIFYHLSFVDSVRINIFQSGVLEYLGNIFKKNWYSGKIEIQTMVNVLFVFKQMSFCPEAHKEMLTDSFLEMILLPFSNSIFSRCHILAGDTLVDLLDTADKCWIARLTKVEVESTVMKSMDKWQLGVICPINYKSLTPQWTNISNGTMVRQRFCAWVIANAIMANPKKYIEMLKKEDFMPKAEAIIADSSTDPEVKRLVKITLDVLKK